MTIRIRAIGTATPAAGFSLDQSVILAQTLAPVSISPQFLQILHQRTGIMHRGAAIVDPASGTQSLYTREASPEGPTTAARLAIYTRAASALAIEASTNALARADLPPSAITHLVTASCTGFESPGFDQHLVIHLPLSRSVRRTHIGFMGCHAALNALAIAQSIAAADPRAVVLICCAEICSVHMHYSARPDQLVANSLFADGAAAAIVSQSDNPGLPQLQTCASYLFPDTQDSMSWHIADHGFEMSLSPAVPDQLVAHVPPWLDSILASARLTRSDIRGWAIHPGGPKIVQTLTRALNLPSDSSVPSLHILQSRGNMSSATVLFILDHLHQLNVPRPHLAMAFGPGLAAEAALLT